MKYKIIYRPVSLRNIIALDLDGENCVAHLLNNLSKLFLVQSCRYEIKKTIEIL